MNKLISKPATLVLSDGIILKGMSSGSEGIAIGEVVFNTGMTGYQEVMTDPSYTGQLITFTYPEIGNTGINSFDSESPSPTIKGVIARQFITETSNWRSEFSLDKWLKDNNVIGIYGIDTRFLVKHIRENGAMNGIICSDNSFSPRDLFKLVRQSPNMSGLNLADEVSTNSSYLWTESSATLFDKRIKSDHSSLYNVVAIDFGIKKSILERLAAHGCSVNVLPSHASISDVIKLKPDGIFLSNGPGDPAAVKKGISLTKDLLKQTNIPIFGICLGHQILGLAIGGQTFKLEYGHRGLNHPCGRNGRVEITSQNHGFALDLDSLSSENIEITHFNLNDKTVAAFKMLNKPVFGIQYHPEASPGPHDSDHHFSQFVSLMAEQRINMV